MTSCRHRRPLRRYPRRRAQVTRQPSQMWRGGVVAADAWDMRSLSWFVPVGSHSSRTTTHLSLPAARASPQDRSRIRSNEQVLRHLCLSPMGTGDNAGLRKEQGQKWDIVPDVRCNSRQKSHGSSNAVSGGVWVWAYPTLQLTCACPNATDPPSQQSLSKGGGVCALTCAVSRTCIQCF